MIRIGHGFDAHKFSDQYLVNGMIKLGGVGISYPYPLIAHSDGDVVLHALCDALLGSVGAGDIGEHFPDVAEKYHNIDSRILLQKTIQILQAKNYALVNVDLTIVAQVPKINPHKQAMRNVIAIDTNLNEEFINIKATTTEGMGYIGRKEGIAVHCVVLVEQHG